MTTTEFEYQFDVLYNNVMSNAVPELNAYEKSVYLTKAQLEVLKNHLAPAGNRYGEGIDDSGKRHVDFSTLISTYTYPDGSVTNAGQDISGENQIPFPEDAVSILDENVILAGKGDNEVLNRYRVVLPLSSEEFQRLRSKPFNEPLKRQVWRILYEGKSILIFNTFDRNHFTGFIYGMRYIRMPQPIILEDLEGVTIGGKSEVSECELPEELHDEVLQRAVELAKAAYGNDQNGQIQMQNQVTVGQRSE